MSEDTPSPLPSPDQRPATGAPSTTPVSGSIAPAPEITKEQRDKKMIAGILGIVVGAFGVHKFFLGYTVEGIIMLCLGLGGFVACGFPTMAVAVVGLIEGILYLTKTDGEFVSTYLEGRRGWF